MTFLYSQKSHSRTTWSTKFELGALTPKLAKTVMNRRDIDLDDYFRSKPLASDEELSALANKIKVEYALLKN